MLEKQLDYILPLYQGNGQFNPKPLPQELYTVIQGEVYQMYPGVNGMIRHQKESQGYEMDDRGNWKKK